MIEFRTLGTVDLRGTRGQSLASVLRQPKCLALFGYLALARPYGYHRRDTLLGLFWPELDERHARAALSQTLYRLRRALGRDALLLRGGEELALDSSRVWCDVAAFEEAIEAGEFEQALELYQGEPLPGFILSEAIEFEQWLATSRLRLRSLAGRAAWKAAAKYEAAGEAEAAVRCARRALALSEDDEAKFRELLGLLAREGDRAGALRAYDDFAARLRQEYGAEPDVRTRAIVDKLRIAESDAIAAPTATPQSSRGPHPAAVPGASVPAIVARPHVPQSSLDTPIEPVPGVEVAGPNAVDARSPLLTRWIATNPRRHVRAVMAMGALALVIAVTWSLAADPLSRATAAPGGARRIAVFPFQYRGSGASADVARGMAGVLGANLDGAGDLRSVDHRALLNATGSGPGPLDPTGAREIANRFGASLYILGDIVETGDRLRITATLHDATDASALEHASADGRADDIFAIVDRLSVRLIAGRIADRIDDFSRAAAMSAGSLPALKAYLEGDADYRAGRYHEAVRALERAVALDTAFAIAHYRLSSAAHWVAGSEIAGRAAKAALRHQERLSRGERLVVAAFERYLAGDVIVAEQLYRQALAIRPHDIEAWFNLAEVQFHWWSYFGRSALDSRTSFERVLEYEPNHPGALLHLARIAASEGRHDELDTLTIRLSKLTIDAGLRTEIDALRGFALHDTTALQRSIEAISEASDEFVEAIVRVIAVHANDLAAAERLARIQASPRRDPLVRGRAHIMLAQIALAGGRWRAANAELDLLEAIQPGWALQYRAAFATAPFLAPRRDDLMALRSALEQPPALQPARAEFPYAPREIVPARRNYLAGLLSLRLGDVYGALRYAVELERPTDDPVLTAYAEVFSRTIRAGLARFHNQPAEALRHLDAPRIPPDSIRPNISSFPDADARFLKAELLRGEGRLREALRWYSSFPDPAAYDLIYLAPAHLRRAQVHEQLAEISQARHHYARVLEIWQDADASVRPWLVQAREGMTRLRS
jgi:serine/threonine-protein kinase